MNNFPRVSLFDFEQNFDHYLLQVENGISYVITRDGKDLAVIMPHQHYEDLINGQSKLPNVIEDIKL